MQRITTYKVNRKKKGILLVSLRGSFRYYTTKPPTQINPQNNNPSLNKPTQNIKNEEGNEEKQHPKIQKVKFEIPLTIDLLYDEHFSKMRNKEIGNILKKLFPTSITSLYHWTSFPISLPFPHSSSSSVTSITSPLSTKYQKKLEDIENKEISAREEYFFDIIEKGELSQIQIEKQKLSIDPSTSKPRHLTLSQLETLSNFGYFEVDSLFYPKKKYRWETSSILQSNKEEMRSNFQSAVQYASSLFQSYPSDLYYYLSSTFLSFKRIGKDVWNNFINLFGIKVTGKEMFYYGGYERQSSSSSPFPTPFDYNDPQYSFILPFFYKYYYHMYQKETSQPSSTTLFDLFFLSPSLHLPYAHQPIPKSISSSNQHPSNGYFDYMNSSNDRDDKLTNGEKSYIEEVKKRIEEVYNNRSISPPPFLPSFDNFLFSLFDESLSNNEKNNKKKNEIDKHRNAIKDELEKIHKKIFNSSWMSYPSQHKLYTEILSSFLSNPSIHPLPSSLLSSEKLKEEEKKRAEKIAKLSNEEMNKRLYDHFLSDLFSLVLQSTSLNLYQQHLTHKLYAQLKCTLLINLMKEEYDASKSLFVEEKLKEERKFYMSEDRNKYWNNHYDHHHYLPFLHSLISSISSLKQNEISHIHSLVNLRSSLDADLHLRIGNKEVENKMIKEYSSFSPSYRASDISPTTGKVIIDTINQSLNLLQHFAYFTEYIQPHLVHTLFPTLSPSLHLFSVDWSFINKEKNLHNNKNNNNNNNIDHDIHIKKKYQLKEVSLGKNGWKIDYYARKLFYFCKDLNHELVEKILYTSYSFSAIFKKHPYKVIEEMEGNGNIETRFTFSNVKAHWKDQKNTTKTIANVIPILPTWNNLWQKVKKLWMNYNKRPDNGFLGSFFPWLFNRVQSSLFATSSAIYSFLIYPSLCLSVITLSSLGIILSPIIGSLYMMIDYLRHWNRASFISFSSLFCSFKHFFLSIFHLILAMGDLIIYRPVLYFSVHVIYRSLVYLIEGYDWLIFNTILKRFARIPYSNSFLITNTAGPGLSLSSYLFISPSEILTLLQFELQKITNNIYIDRLSHLIDQPSDLKSWFSSTFKFDDANKNHSLNPLVHSIFDKIDHSTEKMKKEVKKEYLKFLKDGLSEEKIFKLSKHPRIRIEGEEQMKYLKQRGSSIVKHYFENIIFPILLNDFSDHSNFVYLSDQSIFGSTIGDYRSHKNFKNISDWWKKQHWRSVEIGDWGGFISVYLADSFSPSLLEPVAPSDDNVKINVLQGDLIGVRSHFDCEFEQYWG